MVKTGDIRLVIVMHGLSNLFGGVILQTLLGISMVLAGVYSILLMVLGATGATLFMIYRKRIILDEENKLLRKDVFWDVFSNKGIWGYVALTVFMMLVA